jgi:hypothetical protein
VRLIFGKRHFLFGTRKQIKRSDGRRWHAAQF